MIDSTNSLQSPPASTEKAPVRNIATVRDSYPNVLDYTGYIGLHLACLGAFWTGVTWRDLVLCAVCYFSRMFGLMAGFHRYFSHRSFKTSRAVQFLLALLGTLGVQKGVLWWASTHRHHHRYSDTQHDLHSPIHKSFLYSHSGWFLDPNNRATDLSKVPDLARYPELVWLNRWDLVPVVLFAALIGFVFGWSGLVWGFCISTVLVWHAIHAIGSFGHRFGGYRRFATTDNSRNKWFLALVLLGEGWHNNHHFYPSSARAGFVWWEYDVVYWILKGMERFGLVWDLRVPPEHVRRAEDPRAQAQVRRFERWLMDLRLGVGEHLRAASEAAAPESQERMQLLSQAIELRLDAFSIRVVEQIIKDPELLSASVAELRRDLKEEVVRRLSAVPGTAPTRLSQALDEEVVGRLKTSSFVHFLSATAALQQEPVHAV